MGGATTATVRPSPDVKSTPKRAMHITPTTNSSRQALRHDERAVDPFAATKPSSNNVFRVMSLCTGTPTLFCNKQAVRAASASATPSKTRHAQSQTPTTPASRSPRAVTCTSTPIIHPFRPTSICFIPAGVEGCIPFTAKALKEEKPGKCLYNEISNNRSLTEAKRFLQRSVQSNTFLTTLVLLLSICLKLIFQASECLSQPRTQAVGCTLVVIRGHTTSTT